MKASEAKIITEKVNKKKHDDELNSILTNIKMRADEGHFNFKWGTNMMTETYDELIELGYNIEYNGRMTERQHTISWEK